MLVAAGSVALTVDTIGVTLRLPALAGIPLLLVFALLIVFAPVMIQVIELHAPALRGHFVTIEQLRDFRGYFIVIAFVIAAIVTPPDVISQLALAVPMCLLYEMGIWGSRWFVQSTAAPTTEDSAAN